MIEVLHFFKTEQLQSNQKKYLLSTFKKQTSNTTTKNSTWIELGYAYISAIAYLELAFLWAETSVSSCTQTEDDILNFINFPSTLFS